MESLRQYECPEWFQDAKFGIWAHWGPQSVPMHGDWYARAMYEQHSKNKNRKDTYEFHCKTYGHPSEFGYKDIIPLWKAEKFDPDALMKLYKAAGAKYFVSMGVHHDNFDLWDSKFNRWNPVAMGPKRDIVAAWQEAAAKYDLKFGVSEHLSAGYGGTGHHQARFFQDQDSTCLQDYMAIVQNSTSQTSTSATASWISTTSVTSR